MRQVTRKGLMTVAAATGVLAVTGGYAHADSGASGAAAGSPGVLSGNAVQVPVHIPVNVCGNTVNVIGLLNPAVGNACANTGSGSATGNGGGAHASGAASNSPGVGSGNTVQVPVDVPVNACGNSVDVVGVGNVAGGNHCANTGGNPVTPTPVVDTPPSWGHHTPPHGSTTPPGPGRITPPGTPERPSHPATPHHPGGGYTSHLDTHSVPQPQLAETGSDLPVGTLAPAAAGALLGGVLLYRKARARV
ncbi:chaplin family protein [Streptomyces sp. NPDC052051]|uniref:chaplin n=1 Tax=Streptomyces sp. NPDC052051 TaxID=3154649 RepID=UPI003445D96E